MTAIMGFNPKRLPLTGLALEQGLTASLDGIDIVGNGHRVGFNFDEPRSLISLEDRVPKWLVDLGRDQLTARPEIDAGCVGCGLCVAHCPPKAMEVIDGKARINYEKCIRCYCCQELCPENKVHLREGCLLKQARRYL